MPMSDDGVPVYVRRMDAPGLSAKRPQFVYEVDLRVAPGGCPVHSTPSAKVICQLTSNIRENTLWCADDCKAAREWTQLKKSFQEQGVTFPRVWQDIGLPNPATGKVESDPRKFREHLHVASEEMGERLNMVVDYQPIDLNDRDSLGVTDEGLDATHDHRVRTGQKDSRGRFVF